MLGWLKSIPRRNEGSYNRNRIRRWRWEKAKSLLGWDLVIERPSRANDGDAVYQKQAGSGTWQNFGPPHYAGLFSVTAHAQGAAAATVPEPSELLLLCFGSLGALWRRR